MKEYKTYRWYKEPDGTYYTPVFAPSRLIRDMSLNGVVIRARLYRENRFWHLNVLGRITVLLFADTLTDAKRSAATELTTIGAIPRRANPVVEL